MKRFIWTLRAAWLLRTAIDIDLDFAWDIAVTLAEMQDQDNGHANCGGWDTPTYAVYEELSNWTD